MKLKIFKKIFLVFGVFICIFLFCGCSMNNGNDTESYLHIDFFYDKKDNVLIDNKVVIGIGNSMFDADNNQIYFDEDNYYGGITNICLAVFVDNELTPVDKIEITNEELFSSEYKVTRHKNILGQYEYLKVEDYNKTFEYEINNYDIGEYIKFVISYDWVYQDSKSEHNRYLYLYGKFIDSQFVIYEERK